MGILNFLIQDSKNKALEKYAIDESLIFHTFKVYFDNIKLNNDYKLYISQEEIHRIQNKALIKTLTYKLKKLDEKTVLSLLNNKIHNLEIELNDLDYPSTLEQYKHNLEKMLSQYKRKIENEDFLKGAYGNNSEQNIRFSLNNPISNEHYLDKIFENIQGELIPSKTSKKQFKGLFNGKFKEKVPWLGSLSDLLYFLIKLEKSELIKNEDINNKKYRRLYNSFTHNEFSKDFEEKYRSLLTQRSRVANNPNLADNKELIDLSFNHIYH